MLTRLEKLLFFPAFACFQVGTAERDKGAFRPRANDLCYPRLFTPSTKNSMMITKELPDFPGVEQLQAGDAHAGLAGAEAPNRQMSQPLRLFRRSALLDDYAVDLSIIRHDWIERWALLAASRAAL